MRTIIHSLLATMGLIISASVIAAGTSIENGQPITNADCALLSESVNLNLSASVSGAYQCDSILLNTIRVATCHAAGSRKATSVDCAQTDTAEDGSAVYNDPSCDGTAGQTFEIVDFRAFAASSVGSGVGTVDLGGNCTDASVAGIDHFD